LQFFCYIYDKTSVYPKTYDRLLINYALFSEPELSRGFADLCLILRPDARDAALFDLLFEFKYVPVSKVLQQMLVNKRIQNCQGQENPGQNRNKKV